MQKLSNGKCKILQKLYCPFDNFVYFVVDGRTFEVGGRNKKRKQVADVADAYVVKDDIEYPYLRTIPLYMFGLNY